MIGRLFAFIRRLLSGSAGSAASADSPSQTGRPPQRPRRRPKLEPLKRTPSPHAATDSAVTSPPHRFARFGPNRGTWWDFSRDGDADRLASRELPIFDSPEELAAWLQIPVGQLAWLTHHCLPSHRPKTVESGHYHLLWKEKRSGGQRLIESPKPLLKQVQRRILREILDRIPPHENAHGFVAGRSIRSNAEPHVGQGVVVRFDLENFYANVRFSRVAAVFRRIGYSREAALWLSRLTTSALPINAPFANGDPRSVKPYLPRHLPQGAPTSPALANLSAFSLDVRLSGFAKRFAAQYTRYADDLTFSGSKALSRALPVFLPLVTSLIRSERFRVNLKKRRIVRAHQQQRVTGVVVNRKVNISRSDYDRLKATLHNCIATGPETQNREGRLDFSSVLQGQIAHVAQLNPARGAKLRALYAQIRWPAR